MRDDTTTLRIQKELKKKFEELCESEELPLIKCANLLVSEALTRGYIIKERHELFEKLKKNNA
ncbi:hypothetical protein [Deltalipothrixvirus pozzuoliense]|uniref:Uncharacterized protein ORF62 n=1 Tax=Acidianus filamentous virus 2 (isolate Italy/Pozzuoli) TaxID=654910 RepID=Y062_AFV2P|nr:hypothetical protein AFV2_gp06 [Acidianus filamentous virus 2]Q573G3.1 RecName: Full=Uncharacterized protein ORF62 [Acidianus filamentous virus 2 (isolate Pozzuoli)]CAH69393.1 hypothetical protein [Acidianus filamentous virus 2]